jgi:hypothetical protein
MRCMPDSFGGPVRGVCTCALNDLVPKTVLQPWPGCVHIFCSYGGGHTASSVPNESLYNLRLLYHNMSEARCCMHRQVKLWARCGGKGSAAKTNTSDPSVCCPLESSCNYYNEQFWQCQPPGWVPPPEPKEVYSETCTGKKVREL